MHAPEIKALIKDQIAGRWDESNDHAVDLRSSLVEPRQIPIIFRRVHKGKLKDELIEVWLVLEEDPKNKDGYKIIFDERINQFGLASVGFPGDQHLVLAGYYGDFWTTFKGM